MTNALRDNIRDMYAPPKPKRIKGFIELAAELKVEFDAAKGRVADIDAELQRIGEAYDRAVTERANALLTGDIAGESEAAEAYLRGEEPATRPTMVRSTPVPSEAVLAGLRRRRDSLLQERGGLVGRAGGIRRELRIARQHDAVDEYLRAAEALANAWGELMASSEDLKVATLGMGCNTLRVPAPMDDYSHGSKDTAGALYDAQLLRERGEIARGRDRAISFIREWGLA